MSEQDWGVEEMIKARLAPRSIQDRVTRPKEFAGGWSRALTDYIGFLCEQQENVCPAWSTPVTRAQYLDALWRNDSRLSGVLFTMVSRMASLGWTITGPVDDLAEWYDLFAYAEDGDWTMFAKLVYMDYLTTDEGGEFETPRESYPDGLVKNLWHIDAKRTVPGPVLVDNKVYPLLFMDKKKWKGVSKGRFHRMPSLPSTDQQNRRMGFCFMSRILRYAELANKILQFQEEKVDNLPPQGIATVSGLTRPQLDNAFAEFKMAQEQRGTKVWPGLMWLVSNAFGQEAKVAWQSFREVWNNFSDREVNEIFMKIVSLDAGVDVGEFWQVEFHGATKAASWLQHKKATGKGGAEFIVGFERWAARNTPLSIAFQFDTPDDEQDLMVERIKQARIKNVKDMTVIDPGTGKSLLTYEEGRELLAEQKVIPQRMVQPVEGVVTDILRSRSAKTIGSMAYPSGQIVRHRRYWHIEKKAEDLTQQMIPIVKRWDVLSETFGQILLDWRVDLEDWLKNNPELLARDAYWQGWAERIAEIVGPEYLQSATEGAMTLGISFDRANEMVKEIAGEQAFRLVQVDGDESIVRTTRDFMDRVRGELASGELVWADLEKRLADSGKFSESRSRSIAISENTDLHAAGQLDGAKDMELTEKRSIRADAGRPCPSQVCPMNEAAGFIPINDDFPSGDARPKFHVNCFCWLAFS